MKTPLIENTTDYDARVVSGIVRYVFRHLDLDGKGVMVKVKNLRQNGCHSGRFYPDPHQKSRIYNKYGYSWNDVGPKVPHTVNRLIVCRVAEPSRYPRLNYVYKRKDSPGQWMLADWREALVSVCAHEAMHLRQLQTKNTRAAGSAPGKYNEVDTEWAAYRIHKDWVADQVKKVKPELVLLTSCFQCDKPAVATLGLNYTATKEESLALLCEEHAFTVASTVHPLHAGAFANGR